MNDTTMRDYLEIVNTRVLKTLNSSKVNNELFYADVRTLAELVEALLKFEQTEDRA